MENDSNTIDIDPCFFKNISIATQPVFREISSQFNQIDAEEVVQEQISSWSRFLSFLPNISQKEIHKYLIIDDSSTDFEARGASKHKISGYQLFKENFVKNLVVKPNVKIEINSFLVRANVSASMKKNQYLIYVHFCQKEGDILYAKCNYKAGMGGCCKHVAAVLFQLNEYKQLNLNSVPFDKTCTEVLQQWHVPAEGKNSEPIKLSKVSFEKSDLEKDLNNSRKRPFVSGNRNFCATPIFAHNPSDEKIKKLSDSLYNLGEGIAFANLLKGNNYHSTFYYETSISEYQLNVKELYLNSDFMFNLVDNLINGFEVEFSDSFEFNETQLMFISKYLVLSKEKIKTLERATLSQSTSLWLEERKKRLTSSNFGFVINRQKSIFPASILNRILKNNKKSSCNKACNWGKKNENTAIKKYENIKNVSVTRCGFIINPKWPWLGTSPDGIVFVNEKIRAVEIKCPY